MKHTRLALAVLFFASILGKNDIARAEWQLQSYKDRMADKQVKYAQVRAKEADQGIVADLEMTCREHKRDFGIRLSKPMTRGEIGASLRVDDGKIQPRFLHVYSDPYRIPIVQFPPFDLIGKKRFRLQLHPTGNPPLFFDFDVSGADKVAKMISC